jgi:hypothetical protein
MFNGYRPLQHRSQAHAKMGWSHLSLAGLPHVERSAPIDDYSSIDTGIMSDDGSGDEGGMDPCQWLTVHT